MARTSPSSTGGMGLIPGLGTKIPHASGPKTKNIKQKQYCNKFNKDFKSEKKNLKKKRSLIPGSIRLSH